MESNELFEIRTKISNETGVPIELLDGESEEDNRSRALAILSFKKDHIIDDKTDHKMNGYESLNDKRKTGAEQFEEWFYKTLGKNSLF